MVEKALNIFRQFTFCGISPFCHRQMGQKSIFCRVSVQYVVHGEEYLYRFCITMIIHSSQFIEITSVHCHTLEPVQFCLIVGLIVCLIFEGVTDNVKRIRRVTSAANKRKVYRRRWKQPIIIDRCSNGRLGFNVVRFLVVRQSITLSQKEDQYSLRVFWNMVGVGCKQGVERFDVACKRDLCRMACYLQQNILQDDAECPFVGCKKHCN